MKWIVPVLVCLASFVGPDAGWAQENMAAPKSTKPAVVNLNAASVAQLATLPGIGERTAQRIIEYRQKNGPFKRSEDLMQVKGIGEKGFLKLKDLVTTGPARSDKPDTGTGQ
ncbi:MAG: ComEA family DNA-binding protein [Vicinamibacterales bacterium]